MRKLVNIFREHEKKVIFGGLAVFVIVACVNAHYKKEKLRSDHILTTATIVDYKFLPKSGGAAKIYYEYIAGDNIVTSDARSPLKYSYTNRLLGRRFPLIYHREDVHLNELLVTPTCFKIYGYSFPDSLSWIMKYVDE